MIGLSEKDRMKSMIKDTLMLLVKNRLIFNDKFTVEALIGITVDEGDVMLLSLNEIIQSDKQNRTVTNGITQSDPQNKSATSEVVQCDKLNKKSPNEASQLDRQKKQAIKRRSSAVGCSEPEEIVCSESEEEEPCTSNILTVKLFDKKRRVEQSKGTVSAANEKTSQSEQSRTSTVANVSEKPSRPTQDNVQQLTIEPPRNVKTERLEVSPPTKEVHERREEKRPTPLPINVCPIPLGLTEDIPRVPEIEEPDESNVTRIEIHNEDSYSSANNDNAPVKPEEMAEVDIDWASFSNVISESSMLDVGSESLPMFSSPKLAARGNDSPRSVPNINTQFQVASFAPDPWTPQRMNKDLHHPSLSHGTPSSYAGPNTERSTCNLCGKVFTWEASYKRHMREQHSLEKTIFLCPLDDCDSKLTRKGEMKHHLMKTHLILDEHALRGLLSQIATVTMPRHGNMYL